MKDELELKLQKDFPFMEQHRDASERIAYRRWGCECQDGWYELIQELCQEITNKYTDYNMPVDIVIRQIKQKFARLRVYYEYKDTPCHFQAFDFIGSGTSIRFTPENSKESTKQSLRNEIATIIRKYEKKSASVCEMCGADNAERRNISAYYVRTLCDKCYGAHIHKLKEATAKRKKLNDYID